MISVINMSEHSAQEVFDHVAIHLIRQGKPSIKTVDGSIIKRTVCAYRGDNGAMCAAGCLIPSDKYNPDMEGRSWKGVLNTYKFSESHVELINDLQTLHDQMEDVPNPDWHEKLSEFAERNDFSTEAIDEFKSENI